MVILGVDPSFTATGYAVIKKELGKQFLISCGFIPLPSNKKMEERIGIFYDYFKKIIEQHKVTHLALETPFLGKNAQTFLKLGYLRGCLHLLAYQHTLYVLEYSPKEIKLAVTGFGAAAKDQVQRVVHMLFPGLSYQKTFDVTDAIAISLCGAWQQNII
ncbi:crossover junction endodeoxyribonuclease RuvC [Candidatus Dependentiae bacterium]|nr:crossover junction endodeoxyribonuclease RuvC [Candidatus Dependentiae bacterium]